MPSSTKSIINAITSRSLASDSKDTDSKDILGAALYDADSVSYRKAAHGVFPHQSSTDTSFRPFFCVIFSLFIFFSIFCCVKFCLSKVAKKTQNNVTNPNASSSASASLSTNISDSPSAPTSNNSDTTSPPITVDSIAPSAPYLPDFSKPATRPAQLVIKKKKTGAPYVNKSRPVSNFSTSSFVSAKTSLSCEDTYKSLYSVNANLICKSPTFMKNKNYS